MSDPLYSLTAELEQLFMQNDFDGAKYALKKHLETKDEEIARLRKSNTLLRSQIQAAAEAASRSRRYDDDYIPYPDDEYRD